MLRSLCRVDEQMTTMYTIVHQRTTRKSVDIRTEFDRHLVGLLRQVDALGELLVWWRVTCPTLCAAGEALLAREWPGQLHPLTRLLVPCWLALRLAGRMDDATLARLVEPLRLFELARRVYYGEQPQHALNSVTAQRIEMAERMASDDQEKRIGRLRARRAAVAAASGRRRCSQPFREDGGSPRDTRSRATRAA